jgi:hypothetical protein
MTKWPFSIFALPSLSILTWFVRRGAEGKRYHFYSLSRWFMENDSPLNDKEEKPGNSGMGFLTKIFRHETEKMKREPNDENRQA